MRYRVSTAVDSLKRVVNEFNQLADSIGMDVEIPPQHVRYVEKQLKETSIPFEIVSDGEVGKYDACISLARTAQELAIREEGR